MTISVVRLTSKADIASVLSKPTWSVTDLFNKSSTQHDVPNEETLEKLLKQSALNSARNDPERRDMLLKELKNQLTFVEHVSNVDTDGIEPLVRIGGPSQEFTLDKLEQAETSERAAQQPEWKPTDLAQQKNGNFYVLNEGLRRE